MSRYLIEFPDGAVADNIFDQPLALEDRVYWDGEGWEVTRVSHVYVAPGIRPVSHRARMERVVDIEDGTPGDVAWARPFGDSDEY